MIVDSHCHLNCLKDADDIGGVTSYVDRAREQGVSHFLCVSIDWETYPVVKSIATQIENVFASVGVHPNHDEGYEPSLDDLLGQAQAKEVIAIGETGLDYFRSEGDLKWQRDRFATHIAASRQCGKPLIIHTREAQKDTIDMMRSEKAIDAGGVMHCFTESWEMAKDAMDMGFYISFSGIVTFKSATQLQDVARRVPLDRMLVETDSPYLAPVPFRGKQNEPAYVKNVVDFVAELRGVHAEEIAAATTENFFNLFNSASR